MRKTKIIATVGPASSDMETLNKMIREGVDVIRLNFAHGTLEEKHELIRMIREIEESIDDYVAITSRAVILEVLLVNVIGDIIPIVHLSGLRSEFEIFLENLEHYSPEFSCEIRSDTTDSFNGFVFLLGLNAMTQNPLDLIQKECEGSIEEFGLFVALRDIGKRPANERTSQIGTTNRVVSHFASGIEIASCKLVIGFDDDISKLRWLEMIQVSDKCLIEREEKGGPVMRHACGREICSAIKRQGGFPASSSTQNCGVSCRWHVEDLSLLP